MEVLCPGCGRSNPPGRTRCAECNATLTKTSTFAIPIPQEPRPAEPPTERRSRSTVWRETVASEDRARAEGESRGTMRLGVPRDPATGLPRQDPANPPARDPTVRRVVQGLRPPTGQFATRPPTGQFATRPPTAKLVQNAPQHDVPPLEPRPLSGQRPPSDIGQVSSDLGPLPNLDAAPVGEPDWNFTLPPPIDRAEPTPVTETPQANADAAVHDAVVRANRAATIRKAPPPPPASAAIATPVAPRPPTGRPVTKPASSAPTGQFRVPEAASAVTGDLEQCFLIATVLGEPYALSTSRGVRIGRDPDNDIVLTLSQVSRKHAVVRVEGADGFVVTDLGSANGTFVNGRAVRRRRLDDGDRIVIGPFSLVFRARTGGAGAREKSPEETDAITTDTLGGDLAEVPLASVTRFISSLAKTGELVVNSAPTAGRGTLFFRAGKLVHAERGRDKGEDAALAILRMRQGVFRFAAKPIDVAAATITRELDALIAQAGA